MKKCESAAAAACDMQAAEKKLLSAAKTSFPKSASTDGHLVTLCQRLESRWIPSPKKLYLKV